MQLSLHGSRMTQIRDELLFGCMLLYKMKEVIAVWIHAAL